MGARKRSFRPGLYRLAYIGHATNFKISDRDEMTSPVMAPGVIDPDDVAIVEVNCKAALNAPDAPWRRGILATAVLTLCGISTPIQSQYFTNGARASPLIYAMMVDREARRDRHNRVLLDIQVPCNPAARATDVASQLQAAFIELHEYVMTGDFRPNVKTVVGARALALHLQMGVEAEYGAFIDRELSVTTAIDLMLQAWQLGLYDVVTKCQAVVAHDFATYRPRHFHPFALGVVCEILERDDLVSGGVYTVSDVIQSYINHLDQALPVEQFERMTVPLTKAHEVDPQHAVFFVEQIQGYEQRGEITLTARPTDHRFAVLIRRLETMLARNFFSFRPQELLVMRPGIFANMLASDELVTKGDHDVSNIVALYLKERDAILTTEEFHVAVRVLDDVEISPSDVIFIVQRIERHLPKASGLHTGVERTLRQILSGCADVIARAMQNIELSSFSGVSLLTLTEVLSRDALQCGHEDLVFDLISDYVKQRAEQITAEQIEGLWRTCRFHLLSSACLARAFQQPSLPKSYLAAALIHKQRKETGEVDERRCEFDLYAKSILVLRPRLSLEDLNQREIEDKEMQAVMESQRIDPARCSPIIRVSDELIECTGGEDGVKAAALFSEGFDCSRGGFYSFELRIEKLPAEFWEILVGVCNHDHPVDQWIGATNQSWSYLALHAGSRSYHNSVCGQYNATETLAVGDAIGVVLDCTDRKSAVLSFSVNAADKGTAFEDLIVNAGSSDIANVLYPAISLNRSSVAVKVGRFKWRRH